jgi:hypothetical protein
MSKIKTYSYQDPIFRSLINITYYKSYTNYIRICQRIIIQEKMFILKISILYFLYSVKFLLDHNVRFQYNAFSH